MGELAPWLAAAAGSPSAVTTFRDGFNANSIAAFLEKQAPENRIKVVEDTATGLLVCSFELQQADPEIAGGHRAELVPGTVYQRGDNLLIGLRVKRDEFDPNPNAHYQIDWQMHDHSGGSPPICLQWLKNAGKHYAWIGSGDGTREYWEGEVGEEGKAWVELMLRLKVHNTAGELEIWRDRVLSPQIGGATVRKGLNTEGEGHLYPKLGILRSGASEGTAKVKIGPYWEARLLP